MKLTLEKIADMPETFLGRVYIKNCEWQGAAPEYDGIFTLQIESINAYILGLHGRFTRDTYATIKEKLQSMGIKKVMWETHKNGKELNKVTYI